MHIFADTADIEEIKKLNDLGIIDGVTTNPTLIAKSGTSNFRQLLGGYGGSRKPFGKEKESRKGVC